MRTTKINRLQFINTLKEKNVIFFNLTDIKKIFKIENNNTLKHFLRRQKEANIIKRLSKNKYQFLYSTSSPSDFAIANFLTVPSYISLESALNYYGLIDQFPYHVSSISLSKPKEVRVDKKIFTFSRIKKEYFKDFIKIDDFLIASEEKAVFDYLYFIYKGLRSKKSFDATHKLKHNKKIMSYLNKTEDTKFGNFLKSYVKL